MFPGLYGNTVLDGADPESFESRLEAHHLLQPKLLRKYYSSCVAGVAQSSIIGTLIPVGRFDESASSLPRVCLDSAFP